LLDLLFYLLNYLLIFDFTFDMYMYPRELKVLH